MSQRRGRRQSGIQGGFTIVELLIVVVVIAILAAIIIVSYNGITLNSRNTSRISATSTMSRSLLLYQAAEGKDMLRSLLVGFDQCLGTAYNDVDPGVGVSCRYAEYDHTTATTPVNEALYSEVSKVAKYTINYTPVEQRNFSNVIRIVSSAPFIHHLTSTIVPGRTWQVNGGPQLNSFTFLSYRLEGVDQDCKLQPMLRQGELVGGAIQQYTTGHKNSVTNGGATECWLWLDFI